MKRLFKVVALFSLIFGGASLLFIPLLSRAFLTRMAVHEAESLLQTGVRISSAELRLLQGEVVIQDVAVFHPDRKDEKIIEVGRIDIRVKLLPMLGGGLAGVEFHMDNPKLVYATTKTGQWELSKRFPLLMRGEGEKRLPVNIDEISIKDGQVDYRDGKVGMTTKVNDIDLDVTHVRLPTKDDPLPAAFKMSFDINHGGSFQMKGRADFLSPKISFDSEGGLSGLPLPPYAPYYDKGLPVRITRGSASMSSRAKCTNDYLNAPTHVVISNLGIEPKQAKIFGFASDTVLSALKDKNGHVEMDMLIDGNIRNPQFHVMTDLTGEFVKALSHGLVMAVPNVIGDVLKGGGEGVKKGAESGLDKLKGIFK
ncbi:MAG TPA: DUF748 domain-containing protein [bacterium]|nr:DUF748 domain-containing protein [bacterium]